MKKTTILLLLVVNCLTITSANTTIERKSGISTIAPSSTTVDKQGNVIIRKTAKPLALLKKAGEIFNTETNSTTTIELISSFKGFYQRAKKKKGVIIKPEIARAGGCVAGIILDNNYNIYAIFSTRTIIVRDLKITCHPQTQKVNPSAQELTTLKNFLRIEKK